MAEARGVLGRKADQSGTLDVYAWCLVSSPGWMRGEAENAE